jgi:hypothetical protein
MRARHTLSRHHPRKRMIQYSEASVIEAKVRGVLDTRFRGYDGLLWNTTPRNDGIPTTLPCPAPDRGLSLALPQGGRPDEHIETA